MSSFGQAIFRLLVLDCVYAPCNARVTANQRTNHSIGLTTDTGTDFDSLLVLAPSMNGKALPVTFTLTRSRGRYSTDFIWMLLLLKKQGYENVVLLPLLMQISMSAHPLVSPEH